MTTTKDLLDQTNSELLGAQTEEWNKLRANITTTDESIPLARESKGIGPGKILSVGLEDVYVYDYTPGSNPAATVERGVNGTTKVAHTAGEIVRVAPRFTNFAILRAINAELRSLSSPLNGLFRVRTTDLTSTSPSLTYDLSDVSDFLDPIGIQIDTAGSVNDWPYLSSWELRRNQSETDFSSGLALKLNEAVPNGRPLRLVYSAPFAELTTLTQDVLNVTGLPKTAHDIPPLGAAARLMGVSESRRAFLDGQPDSRRASEVPPGTSSRAAATLLSLRRTRIAEERARLQAQYPIRKWG